MSQITLAPDASGTAIFTVAAPNSSTNRTLTLPDASAILVGDSATQTLTNKSIDAGQLTGNVAAAQITTALNASGSAPIYACRAWVSFSGSATPTIKASGNVSSVTYLATGSFRVNFTTAMPDANYCATGNCGNTDADGDEAIVFFPTSRTLTTSVGLRINSGGGVAGAQTSVFVAIFR